MFEKYNRFFDSRLKIVKDLAESDIETCVQLCEMYENEMYGILSFLHELDIIGYDTYAAERDLVHKKFDSIAVCGAYRNPGKVRRCSRKMRKTLGKS